jgi:hypothetical protein
MSVHGTAVPVEQLMSIVQESGLNISDKKSWVCVNPHGDNGPRIYIPKAKNAWRVDVAKMPQSDELDAITRVPHMGVSGSVTRQLQTLGKTQDEVIADFKRLITCLVAAPKPEPKKAREPKAAQAPASAPTEGLTFADPALQPATETEATELELTEA